MLGRGEKIQHTARGQHKTSPAIITFLSFRVITKLANWCNYTRTILVIKGGCRPDADLGHPTAYVQLSRRRVL